jgi:DNA polymerase/3'-5' exonuclease PolX
MSTGKPINWSTANDNANTFLRLFEGCFLHWYFGGSLRRRRGTVTDVEHIIMPKFVPRIADDLYGTPCGSCNAVWERSEALLRDKTITKAVYGDTKAHRWGEKYRGMMFGGVKHELFMADDLNLGAILTIRTGPAAFSERCVTLLKQGGKYRQEGGYVRRVIAGDVSLLTEHIVPCPTETEYLRLCGLPNIPVLERDAFMEGAQR